MALLAVYGYRFTNDFLLGREHFPPLSPGNVNIVGIDTRKAGYGILVENRVAKLVLGSGSSFGPGAMDEKTLEASDAERVFIPIKDMLSGMQGDSLGLGSFVQRLNNIKDEDLPPYAPQWKTEDIDKAIAGDKPLRAKLIHDLNVQLDGTPLDFVSKNALYNGILVDIPVPLEVSAGSGRKTVIARVKRPYLPGLLKAVQSRLSGKFADAKAIATQYAAEAEAEKSSNLAKEDIAVSLNRLKRQAKDLAVYPQRVLDTINIVLNDDQITGASYSSESAANTKVYTLTIRLTDEGKKRLWQFTRDRVGDQLLITVNGVAIAAPFIDHGIASGEIEIKGLQDETLALDAVNTINAKRAPTKK